ncbi:hypothetical protein EVA_12501, partial [gut metagenome]
AFLWGESIEGPVYWMKKHKEFIRWYES